MATWVIGDLQGCLASFRCLLDKIGFKADRDRLWLTGDLVNRGPDSLGTLRLCHDLRDNLVTVLGNHDLHLLAVLDGAVGRKRKDNFDEVLDAPDRDKLADWLLGCPLLHEDDNHVMTHAGIYPRWTLDQARQHAAEVERVLQDPALRSTFFAQMYGNEPACWDDALQGPERWRTITNFFTRLRLIDTRAHIDLIHKESLTSKPEGLLAWYEFPGRVPIGKTILFGHWAALQGHTGRDDILALDTGCVWGNALTAYQLETGRRIACPCPPQG